MKIRKQYTLYINSMLGVATYGGAKFASRVNKFTFGTAFDCNLSQLKDNLKRLADKGYLITSSKH